MNDTKESGIRQVEVGQEKLERIFMVIVAVIWVMMTLPLPLLNTPVFVAGIPLLWLWVLSWVVLTAVVLTIAYITLEGW